MKNRRKVFGFEIDLRGAWIVVEREPISSCALSDEEVDYQIEGLKNDLDAVAKKMKRAIHEQRSKPLGVGSFA